MRVSILLSVVCLAVTGMAVGGFAVKANQDPELPEVQVYKSPT